MMKSPIRLLMVMALAGCSVLAGCAQTRPKPQVIIEPTGEIRQFKRFEPAAQYDLFHRWGRKAYRPGKKSDLNSKYAGQAEIIQQWGRPDYIRKPFKSLEKEKIEEWVYIEYQTVMQFVDHELVYEGPLTDFEQIMIRKGYPNEATTMIGESGLERQTLIYYGWFPGRLETFNLTNGWIIHSQEGN